MSNEPRIAELTIKVRMVHVPMQTLFAIANSDDKGLLQDELDERIRHLCREATNGQLDKACGFVDATVTSTEKDEDFIQTAFGLIAGCMRHWTMDPRAVKGMVEVVKRVLNLNLDNLDTPMKVSRVLQEFLMEEREHNRMHGMDSKFVYVEKM